MNSHSEILLTFIGLIGLPLLAFSSLCFLLLIEKIPSEKIVTTTIRFVMLSHLVTVLACVVKYFQNGGMYFQAYLGKWYVLGSYGFDLELLFDEISLPILLVMSFLLNVVGHFCTRYLHRDNGFYRFCALYLLFSAGISIVVSAGTVDFLFAGWEFLGISSALLIGYYHDRETPVKNGLYAFIYYRICDVALLAGAVMWHHYAQTSIVPKGLNDVSSYFTNTSPNELFYIALMFICASLAKSAQFPLNGWLPKAMEGPTPSSAIFYGALSIHAGAYLLLRMQPIIANSPAAGVIVIVIGVISASIGALVGRTRSDVKSILAYAAMAQVGLIYVEIGFGWTTIATIHVVGHSLFRSLQFLRSPTVLHDFHQIGAEPILSSISKIELLLPPRLRSWVYRQALTAEESFDALLQLSVHKPISNAKIRVTHKLNKKSDLQFVKENG